MADSKLSALTELAATPAASDEFYVNDGGVSKKIQFSNMAPEGTAVLSTGEAGGTKFLREDGDNTSSWQTIPTTTAIEGTSVLSTGEVGGTKFLREDGDNTSSWQTVAVSTDIGGLGANVATFLATPSSANLISAVTDETGTGALVFATSPTLVTPALGTPASGNLANCTAYEGTAIASTGEAGGTKFLREDGDGTCSWQEAGGGWDVDDDTDFNYGHGLNALNSLTASSGLRNCAVGNDAGTALTTQDDNCFFGHNAGKAFTNINGVFVGASAGEALTSSSNTTIVGGLSVKSTTNASQGTFVGTSILGSCTGSLIYMTAIGDNIGASMVGNDFRYGVVIGSGAANTFTTFGTNNTIIGLDAANTGTTLGADNTMLGTSTGRVLTGSGNVLLGSNAGRDITSSDYSIFIGKDPLELSATDNDQFLVGHTGAVLSISGYLGARSDVDYSGKTLTISGPSAFPAAASNQNGGDLILQGGAKASGGGTPGDVLIGTGYKFGMNRTTEDAAFINFQATADADATSAISTLTTSGATTHHIQIEINGTTAWIAASTTDPT